MTLPGGYVIQELVGTGGMACVYRAEQTKLGRTVAVKIVHSHLLGDEGTAKRFIREARAASRLNHPHSLAVIDFGRMQDGLHYLVMEYLAGRDLARVVSEEGPLEIKRVLGIMRQLLDALAEAHQLGIIHRDLKPENIVVEQLRSGEDFVKVVDFGLAKLFIQTEDVGITAAGTVCGTPDFMSPEQCRGDTLDPRSDLYSVGVNLFVLLTGRLPFEAPTPTQALLLHLTAAPPDPRSIAPNRQIPAALAEITLRAMAKNRADRFQSAQELSEALAAIEASLAPSTPEAPGPSVSVSASSVCRSCGADVPATSKFCGECGTPMAAVRVPHPAAKSEAPPMAVPPDAPGTAANGRMIGRDDELAALVGALQAASGRLDAARVIGETGIGRTRLLEEIAARALRRGHVVARVKPDPWRAGVAWFALRDAICQLAGLPPDGGMPARWSAASPSARAGLALLFGAPPRVGASTSPPGEVRKQASTALLWALDIACRRAEDASVLLLIDDLDIVDGVSRNAFSDLVRTAYDGRVFVVASHDHAFDPGWPDAFAAYHLERLSPSQALELIVSPTTRATLVPTLTADALPLFVLHAVRFVEEGAGVPPPSLGDLVTARLVRLSRHQRRVLQTVAVLGDAARTDQIGRLLGDGTPVHHAARELIESGLLRCTDAAFHIAHPLLREVVLSTLPAAAARQLHEIAAELSVEEDFPAEVRARFSLASGDAFGALLLLDRIGALAMGRDDGASAIEFFRRGFAFAKAEVGRGELDDPQLAVVVFGRKLGDALIVMQRFDEAEPLLREILGLSDPATAEHAKILVALARIAQHGRRVAEAARLRHEAISAAGRAGDEALAEDITRLKL